MKKIKTGVKNLKIEEVIAFDKRVTELFFVFSFHNNKSISYIKKLLSCWFGSLLYKTQLFLKF